MWLSLRSISHIQYFRVNLKTKDRKEKQKNTEARNEETEWGRQVKQVMGKIDSIIYFHIGSSYVASAQHTRDYHNSSNGRLSLNSPQQGFPITHVFPTATRDLNYQP